ncbi:PAAR-like protein [Tenacibaculum ovolyticum]|uniref:PAAR-like protein n=1 Tax=Tenacibaculum ovolyticum TaxID=104270 RepID=UPI001F1BED77|nr:PAAR-like protein [Tenacibaculum ovolyticum]
MSKEGKLVCYGAECECQFGNAPDKLIVETQSKRYINDPDGAEKLMATNKEIGQPFEAKTFGQCKMQPTPGGYKPCQPMITEWQDFYDKVTLSDNGGNPLLEGSKAICAISGAPCVSITYHGQTGEPVAQNFKQEEKEEDTASQINPLVNSNEVLKPIESSPIKVTRL